MALRAARPWSFTATVTPVALGSALAFKVEDAFSLPILLLTLATTLGVHGAGNLMNTLFDFSNGVDSETSSDTTLVKGELLPRQVSRLVAGWFGLAAAAAVPLCALSRAPLSTVLALIGLGAGSSYIYSGGPGLKYKALGDILITATFGPLLVAFSYLTQAGKMGWGTLLAALPVASHIEAILHANNARDVDEDVRAGVHTLASKMSAKASLRFYQGLLGLPFALSAYTAVTSSAAGALPLLAAPKALRLVSDFGGGNMVGLPKRTAKFQFGYGLLLVLSVLVPSPSIAALVQRLLSR